MVRAADVQRIIATLTVPSSGLSDSDSDDDEPRGNFNVSTTSFSRGWSGFGEEYSPTTIFPGRWGGYRGEDFGRVSFPPASSVEELRPHLVHLIDFPALWPRTLWYREGAGMQIVGVLAEALDSGLFNVTEGSAWERIGGPELLERANLKLFAQTGLSEDHRQVVASMLVTMATHLQPANRPLFPSESGLADFCQTHADTLQQALVKSSRNWKETIRMTRAATAQPMLGAMVFGFAAHWPSICPSLFSSSRERGIALLHRLLKEMILQPVSDSERFHVSRETAFEDSVFQLTKPVWQVRQVVHADFRGENGIGQGVARDWFSEVAAQIYNPNYALFEKKSEAPHYTKISSMASFQDNPSLHFKAVGRFLGLSIVNDNPIGVTFPVMFYAHILGVELDLLDIAEDEPDLFQSFSRILKMESDQLEDNRFEVEVAGEHLLLTVENRDAVIRRKINSLISPEEAIFIDMIAGGLFEMIPKQILVGFISPSNLRDIVYGNPTIDVDDFAAHARYASGYSESSPQIGWLLNLLRSFDLEMKQKFLRFVTGSARLPLGGFEALHIPIQVQRMHSTKDSAMPLAHTCFHQLELPTYSSEAVLTRQMILALNSDFGMGLT